MPILIAGAGVIGTELLLTAPAPFAVKCRADSAGTSVPPILVIHPYGTAIGRRGLGTRNQDSRR